MRCREEDISQILLAIRIREESAIYYTAGFVFQLDVYLNRPYICMCRNIGLLSIPRQP